MTFSKKARQEGVGLALALISSLPAAAGDWNNGAGSIKDYGGSGGIPVPAPVPVPEYAAQWYFRGDLGIGFGADPSVSRTGRPFGTADSPGAVGPEPFGFGGAHFTSYSDETEFSPSYTFGLGVGRYVTSRFRVDLTGEYRGDHDADASGTYQYNGFGLGPCGAWCRSEDAGGNANVQVDGRVQDRTRIRSGLFMLNGYWDLMQRGHLTPYVGAGIGFSLNEAERSMSGSETVCDPSVVGGCAAPVTRTTYSGTTKSVTSSLALSLMAGVSYNIAANTKLDLNYRYLYVGGYDVNMNINAVGVGAGTTPSTLRIGDQHEHQIRAGLRWDIN